MMSKKWQCKLLSVVLCASLVAPNLSISAYASEKGQILQPGGAIEFSEENLITDEVQQVTESSTENTESKQQEDEGNENAESTSVDGQETENGEDVSGDEQGTESTEGATGDEQGTESTEDVTGDKQGTESTEDAAEDKQGADTEEDVTGETEEIVTKEDALEEKNAIQSIQESDVKTTSGTESGSFSEVSITSQGFEAEVTGTFTLSEAITDKDYRIYLVQYDTNDTRLLTSDLGSASAENRVVSIARKPIYVHQNTTYFRVEAHSTDGDVISSETYERTNKPEITIHVEDVLEGGTLGFVVNYTGDLQLSEDKESESFYVELLGGTSDVETTWEKLGQGSAGFSKDNTKSNMVSIAGLTPQEQPYYGKLVFYSDTADEVDDYQRIRYFEQEVALEPFHVTESFGYFEDVKMNFGGMGVKPEYTFNYTGYQQDETVTIYLVQLDGEGNELYSYKIIEYSGVHAWINTYHDRSLWTHKDAVSFQLEARGNQKTVKSEAILREVVPEINFSIDTVNSTVEETKVSYRIGFQGNLLHQEIFPSANFKVVLRAGTSENKEEWQEIEEKYKQNLSYSYSDYSGNEGYVWAYFEGLEPGTTYYGELVLSAAQTKGGNQGFDYVWDAVIPVTIQTEEQEVVYTLSEIFPDEALREMIKNRLGTGQETATEDALKNITEIYSYRTDFNEAAVKDITGLDKLTGLMNLVLENHEIKDVSKIDWSKLTNLGYLNLEGNDITAMPDLSQNSMLRRVNLAYNKLSQEELAKAKDLLPAEAALEENTEGNQRVNGFEIVAEDNYYYYGDTVNVYVQTKGMKQDLPYKAKFYVDDAEQTFDVLYEYEKLYALKNANLTEGAHTLKVELWKGDIEVEETVTHTFNVVRQHVFAEKTPYCIDSDTRSNSYIDLEFYFPTGAEVSNVEVVKDNKVYFKQNEYNQLYTNQYNGVDPRYPKFKDMNGMYNECSLYYVTAGLTATYFTTPAGSYDLKITFTDESVQTVQDAILVSDSGKTIITDCSLGSSYDNMGNYLYVVLEGWNIKPGELEFSIKQNETIYPLTYVNHRYVYSGMVVKLQKEDWTRLEDQSVQIVIKGEDDTANFISDSVYMSGGVYYAVYNRKTGKVEAAFSTDTNANGKTVTVSAKTSWDGEVVATGSTVVTDGVGYFTLKNTDGSAFPSTPGYYYFDFDVDGMVYENSTDIYNLGNVNSVNYWSASTSIYEGNNSPVMWYYSDLEYNTENAKASSYTAQITGEALDEPITITSVEDKVKTDDVNGRVAIGMDFDESKLKAGNYEVTLYREEQVVASNQVEVKASERFILHNLSAYWNDSSTINVSMTTTSDTSSDTYTVTLTDINGMEIEGLKTKVIGRYGSSIFLSVTGLNYKNAAKKYYVKVTQKRLGEACKTDGTSFYEDEKGNLQEMGLSAFSYVTDEKDRERVASIYVGNVKFPVTIGIYRPYLTEPVKEIKINSKSELTGNYYHFSKTFCNSLPDVNGIYDIVCVDSEQQFSVFDSEYIGYMEGIATTWDYTIDKTSLYMNDNENKTATVTVFDNKGTPTYKSSDTSVVTIKADTENPNKAVITAVGIGMAEISITADNITRRFMVTSNRKVTLEAVELTQSELTLGIGEIYELKASVYPAEAWNEDLEYVFSTETPEVIRIDAAKDTAVLTALKAGDAVVTVTIKDTDLTAECNVTVKNIYNTEERNPIIEEAGTNFILLNNYKDMKAFLKDVELPEYWTWVDDSVKLTADDAAPVQYYTAVYDKSDDNYEAFTAVLPVAVSQITGISISGDKSLVTEGTETYQAVVKYKGYTPNDEEYTEHYKEYLKYQWSAAGKSPLVTIAGEGKEKNADITAAAGITKNKTQKVNLTATVNEKVFKASLDLTLVPAPFVDEIQVTLAEEQPDTVLPGMDELLGNIQNIGDITIDLADISTAKNNVKNTVQLSASAFAKDAAATGKFKWSSSDTSVVAVKADKNSENAVLTFKKAGSAIVHVIAQDGGKYDREILVTIKDYAPILENSTIALDLYSTEGTIVPVRSQNENEIIGIAIQEQVSKEWVTSDKFEAAEEDGKFIIKGKEGYAPSKNAKVKVQLQITTEGYEEPTSKAATISVNVKNKPTASLKNTAKANLFYKDATAEYQITSKYEIESIEDVTVTDENGNVCGRKDVGENSIVGFSLKDVAIDGTTGTLTFDTFGTLDETTWKIFKDNKTAGDNGSVKVRDVKLKVSFKDYTEAADQIINVTVTAENKVPSLKLNDLMLLSGMTENTTQVYDTKAKTVYSVDTFDVTITSKTNGVEVEWTDEGNVKVTYAGTKDVKYNVELKSKNDWTQTVSPAGKISISTAAKQNLVLDNSKITLNMEHNIQKNGEFKIAVAAKNNDSRIEDVIPLRDSKNKTLFDSGYLYIDFNSEEQVLYVGLNRGMGESVKAGTYKVNLVGKIMVGETEQSLKATTLTITLADKAPTVSLKAKGSIDLVRRQDTSIVYTPTYKNVTAEAKQVRLSGAYAEYFSAKVEEGKVIVSAREDKAMSTKITYPVNVTLTLDNGCEVTSTIKIKPVNKLPKLTAQVTKATLYKLNPEEEIIYQIIPNDSKTSIDKIERVEDKNSKYFDFAVENDKVTVSLSTEANKMKPGKYTVSYKVYMEGAAYNVKPTTLKLTVTVK